MSQVALVIVNVVLLFGIVLVKPFSKKRFNGLIRWVTEAWTFYPWVFERGKCQGWDLE